MSRIPAPVSLLVILLAGLLFEPLTAQSPRHLVVACEDKEDPPRLTGSGSSIHPDRPGTAIEILRLIARQQRLTLDIRRYPWKRSLAMLARGEIDLLLYASYTPERAAMSAYPMRNGFPDSSRRFATLRYVVYRRRGTAVTATPGLLTGTRGPVGVPSGYSAAALLRSRGFLVDESQSSEIDLTKLAVGRVEAVVALEETADHIVSRNPELARKIEKAGILDTRDYYFVFSKTRAGTSPDLVEGVWNELARYRESPIFREIEESYRPGW